MTSTLQECKHLALISALRRCQLFAGVNQVELASIAETALLKQVPKGAYLFHEGEPSVGFYIVQRGAINIHRVNATGKEQVIHVFRAGESFAEGAVATDKGYPADARAVEDSQVLLILKAGILALIRRQPELALRMLASMGSHLRVLVLQLEDLTLKDVETRLANWLVKRCPNILSNVPVKIELPTTKRVLAAEIGTISETFSRTLGSLRSAGLIEVNGKSITVRSPQRLAALLRRNLGE
jgi:CRP/FNR family transcriptional regulator